MLNEAYIREIVQSLSEENKEKAKNANTEFVGFLVSVFNVGYYVDIIEVDDPDILEDEFYNGYSFVINSDEISELLTE